MSPTEQPIRIAQVLNRMDSGGIEAVVMNYYRHIDRKQIQFDFYFAEDSTFPQREELERLGAGIYPVPAYSHLLAYHRILYSAFREHGYKVVHAHLSTMSVFALFAAWRAGVPVRICHNHSTAHRGEGKKTLLKYLLRPFNKLFANEWFACGEKAGRWMYGDRAFEKGKVHVMTNAIDTEKFIFDPTARDRLRQELNIPQEVLVVGHVGRFMYQKNHMFLLDVFAKLMETHKEARLLLVGEGELEQQIKSRAAQIGVKNKTIFAGVRSNMQEVYSAMDIFCLPSYYEGLPVVALEVQANGLPCLFSDVITPEVMLSTNAMRIPLGNTIEWTSAITQMGGNRTKRQCENIPDIKTATRKIAEFYIQCVHKNESDKTN